MNMPSPQPPGPQPSGPYFAPGSASGTPSHGAAYPHAPMPGRPPASGRRSSGYLDAIPPIVQGLISAVLLLPMLGLYRLQQSVGYWSGTAEVGAWVGLGIDTAICVYLLLVLAVWARRLWRRIVGAVLALIAMAITVIVGVIERNDLITDYGEYLVVYYVLTCGVLGLQLLAWAVARRKHPLWVVGLVPAIGLVILVRWILQDNPLALYYGTGDGYSGYKSSAWLAYFAVDLGLFVFSTLVIWGFDGIGQAIVRSARRQPDHPPSAQYGPPQAYPGSPYGHANSPYGSAGSTHGPAGRPYGEVVPTIPGPDPVPSTPTESSTPATDLTKTGVEDSEDTRPPEPDDSSHDSPPDNREPLPN